MDDEDTITLPTIISRSEAKTVGLNRYFDGSVCRNGHVAERYVSNCGCVTCRLVEKAEYRANNQEKIKAYGAAYEKSAKRQSAERKASMAAYRANNKERQKELVAAWYKANTEKHRQMMQDWSEANRDLVRAYRRNRGARMQAADGHHTTADIRRIYNLQGGRCAYCRKNVGTRYHVDHIMPLSKGGSNWPANLQVLCPTCNCQKHAKDPIDHAQSLGFLL